MTADAAIARKKSTCEEAATDKGRGSTFEKAEESVTDETVVTISMSPNLISFLDASTARNPRKLFERMHGTECGASFDQRAF
jgi:hypothetical protein